MRDELRLKGEPGPGEMTGWLGRDCRLLLVSWRTNEAGIESRPSGLELASAGRV